MSALVGFRGYVDGDAAQTHVAVAVYDDGERLLAQRRPSEGLLHSPTGFAWGYAGSGPATLARCILWECLGWEPSRPLYQRFKFAFVSRWPEAGGWSLSVGEIETWLRTPEE